MGITSLRMGSFLLLVVGGGGSHNIITGVAIIMPVESLFFKQ